MYRDDYILRLIAQFAEVLTFVLGLRRDGKLDLALSAVDQSLRNLLGIGSDQMVELSDSQALALLRFDSPGDSWRIKGAVAAALLREEGAILALRDRLVESDIRYVKALQLTLEIRLGADESELPEFTPAVDELVTALRGVALPPKTGAALLHYYEQHGAFARAEDVLFDLLGARPDDHGLAEVGMAFYERLLELDDARLAAGNLPRDEVQSSLAELRRRPLDANEV
jgi:hypothetical protein